MQRGSQGSRPPRTLQNRAQRVEIDLEDRTVEELHADRDSGLDVLAGRTFDATVDVSAYFPRQVDQVAYALGGEPDVAASELTERAGGAASSWTW